MKTIYKVYKDNRYISFYRYPAERGEIEDLLIRDLECGSYSDTEVIGVYDTREEAEKVANSTKREIKFAETFYKYRNLYFSYIMIDVIVVDDDGDEVDFEETYSIDAPYTVDDLIEAINPPNRDDGDEDDED